MKCSNTLILMDALEVMILQLEEKLIQKSKLLLNSLKLQTFNEPKKNEE